VNDRGAQAPAAVLPVERAVARVDLAAIEQNCALLKERLGAAALCAVVKADGYGHGALPAASAALAGGATWLAVATAREAAALREGGIAGRILVMGALTRAELATALAAGADIVAWTREFLSLAAATAAEAGRAARIHSKLDTGMGRLGTRSSELALVLLEEAEAAETLEAVGLMTHFATADAPDPTYLDEQLVRFAQVAERARAALPALVVHAANSAAVLAEPASHFNMARCGVAIYGLDPFQSDPRDHGLVPALALDSYVASVKPFERGESAGYGRTWRAREDTLVATLPIGYGDGYRRGLSNVADVLIRGRRHRLAGTVSMDNVTVDLGAESDVQVGERTTLIGSQGTERVHAEELARALGTINYEITCGLTSRVPRRYEE
jgi:alanine racemase